jgi:hypothetical protein
MKLLPMKINRRILKSLNESEIDVQKLDELCRLNTRKRNKEMNKNVTR